MLGKFNTITLAAILTGLALIPCEFRALNPIQVNSKFDTRFVLVDHGKASIHPQHSRTLIRMAEFQKKRIVGVLFRDFTALDFFGPISIFKYAFTDAQSRTPLYTYETTTLTDTHTISCEGVVADAEYSFNDLPNKDNIDILIIPGGLGTRKLVDDDEFIQRLRFLAEKAKYVLTICTGSALLAKTGLLDGIQATSNKFSWSWVVQQGPKVDWLHEARWVDSGKITTSAGVSAGIDMTLYWVTKHNGFECAKRAADMIEYSWRGITDTIGLENDHQFDIKK